MIAEKYRPEKLDDIIGHPEIVKSLKSYVKNGNMPNLILIGNAGIGKTTAAIALAREFGCYPNAFLEINASDDNGIAVMRGAVKEFCKRKSFAKVPFKIILLDEGDNITKNAQEALRRTMEQYSNTTRFIITSNSIKDIISPIQSRCERKFFRNLSESSLQEIMLKVQIGEGKILSPEVNKTIIELAEGDARAVINLTESALSYDGITPDTLYRMSGMAGAESVRSLLTVALRGEITALDYINKLLAEGVSATELLNSIYFTAMRDSRIPTENRLDILEVMRMIPGIDEKMVLAGTIAALIKLRRPTS